jgi:CheY-like chemotaxis protein
MPFGIENLKICLITRWYAIFVETDSTISSMTILHVDDDFEEREIFSEALASIDPSIHFMGAYSGPNALSKLQDGKIPDLIILDINMPLMNGFEFLQSIKQIPHLASIPVILYSTSASEKDISKGLTLGATNYIVKPNNLNTLKENLRRILKQQRNQNVN